MSLTTLSINISTRSTQRNECTYIPRESVILTYFLTFFSSKYQTLELAFFVLTMAPKSPLPLGFRFKPTKEEIFQFLLLKINGQELPCGEGVIGELNVYDEGQLEEIFSKGEKEDQGVVYTFMRLKNKSKNATKQKDRRVGKGTWKSQQKGKLKYFGEWRDFRYENSRSKRHNRKWNMTEYFLDKKRYPHVSFSIFSL